MSDLAWPPSPALLAALLHDFYDQSVPTWRDPDSPADVTTIHLLWAEIVDESLPVHSSRFYKYLKVLKDFYEKRPSWQEVAGYVHDGDTALAMLLLLDQMPRYLGGELDGGAYNLIFTDDVNQKLIRKHIFAKGYDHDPKIGGRRNALAQVVFWIVLVHQEAMEGQSEARQRLVEEMSIVSAKQRKITLWASELGRRHLWYIRRFGRYPYWNGNRRREWTAKELEWKAKHGPLPSYYPDPFVDPLPPSKEDDAEPI